jgi:mannose-6-phosphate isomerase-like protein (cupin superfamily)
MRKEAEIHIKGWGKEEWIVNNDKYCGKILYFDKGKKCSFHKHKIKDETFRLSKGKMILRGGYDEDINKAKVFVLQEGDIFHIPVGYIHQMEAIEDSELYEFSTQHFESDSYRIIKGD